MFGSEKSLDCGGALWSGQKWFTVFVNFGELSARTLLNYDWGKSNEEVPVAIRRKLLYFGLEICKCTLPILRRKFINSSCLNNMFIRFSST